VRIINEPTAAALTYETDHEEAKTILVYDLGGGTFDVSVVRMSRRVTEVLASHGNNQLGGDDFDAKLVEHVVAHLKDRMASTRATSVRPWPASSAPARRPRSNLSDAPYARIEEEYLLEHKGAPVNLSLEIDRSDYEDLIATISTRPWRRSISRSRDAGMTVSHRRGAAGRRRHPHPGDPAASGGDPRHAAAREVDPDLCVADGAAIQAAVIAGQRSPGCWSTSRPTPSAPAPWAMLDGELYPYTYVPLIRKNTPIPVTKSEAFYTAYDGQQIIEVMSIRARIRTRSTTPRSAPSASRV
jgi:molecular chaperone DnaK